MATFNPPRDEDGRIIIGAEESPAAPDAAEMPAPAPQDTPPARTVPVSPEEQRPMSELLGAPPTQSISWRTTVALIGAMVLIGAVLMLLADIQNAPRPAAPAPTTLAATSTPTEPTLPRAVVAWSAPNGEVLGALERGQTYRPAARSGEGWYQVEVDSGLVWVRARDLGERLAGQLPDLATPIPTAVPVVTPEAAVFVCDRYSAPWFIAREVEDERGMPIGSITAWSCISRADAEYTAAMYEAQLRADAKAANEAER
jgi:hypothetical protein